MSMTRFQASMPYSPTGLSSPPMPALLTARWSAPNLSSARPTAARAASAEATSCFTAAPSPPPPSMRETTRCAALSSMSVTITRAPCSARRNAITSPIPDPAPVTMATLFSNSRMISIPLSSRDQWTAGRCLPLLDSRVGENRGAQLGDAHALLGAGDVDHRVGGDMLARLRLYLGERGGQLARLHLVGLGENEPVADRGLVEHREHVLVGRLDAVAAVDEDQGAAQDLAAAQEIAHQAAPALDHFDRGLGEAVARHVDQPEPGRIADLEEVQFLRAPGRDRRARDRLAAGYRVDERALADVRAARESDLGEVGFGQEVERRRGEQELDAAGEQPARFFAEVRVFHQRPPPLRAKRSEPERRRAPLRIASSRRSSQ